jgi:hypothetical protein
MNGEGIGLRTSYQAELRRSTVAGSAQPCESTARSRCAPGVLGRRETNATSRTTRHEVHGNSRTASIERTGRRHCGQDSAVAATFRTYMGTAPYPVSRLWSFAAGGSDTVAESLRANRETEAPLVYVESDADTQLTDLRNRIPMPNCLSGYDAARACLESENNGCEQCCSSSPLGACPTDAPTPSLLRWTGC